MDSLKFVTTLLILTPFASLNTSLVSCTVSTLLVTLVTPFTMVGMKLTESSSHFLAGYGSLMGRTTGL